MKNLVILAAALFLVAGCDKKNGPKSNTQLLAQANWKFSAATMGGADVSGSIDACYKDNILTFNENGTGTADEGATKCNPGDPQSYAITWNFLGGETQIKILPVLFPGGSDTYTIVTLSETQLVLSQVMTLPPPFGAQTVVVTFIH